MKAEVKKLPKSQVEITITVPYADYMEAEKKAMAEINKELKVDGFRPGHIPEAVVREKVDQRTINGMTLEFVVPATYAEAVKENDVQVIAQPKIEVRKGVEKEGDELVYVATVSVMPEVKLGDYKKIKVKRKEVKVSDKEVDETIEMLVNRFSEWKDVEREAKDGDRVELDFEGFDEEGKAIPNTASKNHPVVLGSKSLIPGFEEEVAGMKVGEEKEFDITFPKDYHAKDMQGRKVKFKLKLGRLEERTTNELDEAMVEKITGQKQPVEDFKKRVHDDLMAEMTQRNQADLDNQVVAEIIKITSAELPDSLIEDEIHLMKEERKQQVARQGLSWEQYLSHIKKTDEEFAKDHRKGAEERLMARLGVNQIIREEKIEASDEDVSKKIQEMVAAYPAESSQQVLDYYKAGSEAYRQLKNNLSADKLINMFIE
ncbi:MAG: trigger factor [Candidatus Peregrinibacteria bacterium]|nr:trigger factor [Candidatus Peregrinibacteria bacterium]